MKLIYVALLKLESRELGTRKMVVDTIWNRLSSRTNCTIYNKWMKIFKATPKHTFVLVHHGINQCWYSTHTNTWYR